VGGGGLGSLEVTSADLGLLVLADGRHTVREIAERVNASPMEIARTLARFRLAGVLELAPPPASPAMAVAG
jgi:aminopeptidase-like protein